MKAKWGRMSNHRPYELESVRLIVDGKIPIADIELAKLGDVIPVTEHVRSRRYCESRLDIDLLCDLDCIFDLLCRDT